MKRDCIILVHLSKIDLVTSVFVKVVDCIILELWFKMYPEVSAPMNVVGLHHP